MNIFNRRVIRSLSAAFSMGSIMDQNCLELPLPLHISKLCVPCATQEPLPLGISSQCAPIQIVLFLPNWGRDRNPSQKMSPDPSSSRKQGEGRRGWQQKRGRTKYVPGQCYCCTFYRTKLSMALSITEKTLSSRHHC